ncbi:metal-dependent hydrolase [Apilactobacillus micheneri]|uniref:Metal-dependent hydrolase n=1 Tax=Apilactobacillus micheneri TaxID=1899430 RepID=A0A9Q8IPG9_9LACO|nr:metal-dependent hydrolase [Apilactobacillus micheneri]TPR40650.1 metal-dependent hydrolase [Apilactobacillus micheneri]TPR42117.1 metal-dependent hydrolase [Apilactobacillus micheneri]TPR44772.1 metal-dependent hydrolase [Apilactobacillus micheneri]TPR45071.1 metal-dependent hydrolase [Apilactobacillus micheneri]TPR46413.1 metal-dependent hydrolase [Apilactobacillus micheneri]
MALRRTHIALSEAITLGFINIEHQSLLISGTEIIGIWIGAQLPDIDQKQTKINKKVGLAAKPMTWWGHRTWSHTIWIIALLFFISYYLSSNDYLNGQFLFDNSFLKLLYYGVSFGTLLHIIEDSFSIEGVRWFYPFDKNVNVRKKGFFRYKVGGKKENLILFISILIIIFNLIIYVISFNY